MDVLFLKLMKRNIHYFISVSGMREKDKSDRQLKGKLGPGDAGVFRYLWRNFIPDFNFDDDHCLSL